MRKGWYGEKSRHSMASKGIKTSNLSYDNISSKFDMNELKKNNIYIEYLREYNLPYNTIIYEEDFDKYVEKSIRLAYDEPNPPPDQADFSFPISPDFTSVKELSDWWKKNKHEIISITQSKKFKEQQEMGDAYDDEYGFFRELGKMHERMEKMFKKYTKTNKPNLNDTYINVYHASQGYGGAEEGGWWYDVKEPHLSVRVRDNTDALKLEEELRKKYPRTGKRSSVLGGDDFDVRIQGSIGSYSPRTRPRYS